MSEQQGQHQQQQQRRRQNGRGSSGGRGSGRGRGRGGGGGGGSRHGRGQGQGRGRKVEKQQQQQQGQTQQQDSKQSAQGNLLGRSKRIRKVLLVLHGNRQSGQLLLGRMDRLQKRLWNEFGIEMIAPDAPFHFDDENDPYDDNNDDDHDDYGTSQNLLLTWWKRDGDNYIGLEKSLETLLRVEQGDQQLHQQSPQERKETADDNIVNEKIAVVGILGFSQGARLAHLVSTIHQQNPTVYFPHLRFVILVAGYDAPVPPQLLPYLSGGRGDVMIVMIDSIKSLHIWGESDTLVVPAESQSLVTNHYDPRYVNTYVHQGNHFVPMKGSDMHIYINFVSQALLPQQNNGSLSSTTINPQVEPNDTTTTTAAAATKATMSTTTTKSEAPQQQPKPDEESAALQREEIVALDAIFPDAIQIRSFIKRVGGRDDSDGDAINGICDEDVFEFPIVYDMKLLPNDDGEMDGNADTKPATNWPVRPLTLRVQYPYNYPLETTPQFTLIHENNVWEFPSSRVYKLMMTINETAMNELGMSSVMSCLYAAKEYLDLEPDANEGTAALSSNTQTISSNVDNKNIPPANIANVDGEMVDAANNSLVARSTKDEIAVAVKEGLDIAESLLNLSSVPKDNRSYPHRASSSVPSSSGRNSSGGSFGTYTMGLVGKPSAGKSTFFNAATAFSRQRGQQQQRQQRTGDNTTGNSSNDKTDEANEEAEWGGASMAAHPFTTIDPNIGYCLVPAPFASCPEDYFIDKDPSVITRFGSTHGRDPRGRRFLPVLLKDVAGLVPGAYQGRGRGNQFLNDLTDAIVLIHVVDASGTSDESGNKTVVNGEEVNGRMDGDEYSNPLDDLAWIRNELVEWVFSNLLAKWDVVVRKGKAKLAGMFSGYGQKEAVVDQLLVSLETFMEERHGMDRVYDNMSQWTEADVHRLVSLFLGVRFPMALCLNKIDLPSAKDFVRDIEAALPIHGAYAGTPLAAKEEMLFVRDNLRPPKVKDMDSVADTKLRTSPPLGVWKCLSSAVMLQEPVLVFPVNDLTTLAPLPGLSKVAVEDPSLPSRGMIQCIQAAGGSVPTCWNVNEKSYVLPSHSAKERDTSSSNTRTDQLRDVLLMRPGSTVEDVFFALKRMGGLGGEFVRAEAFSGRPGGSKPKPIPKHEQITVDTCVIKIMSNKRSTWQ